MENKLVSSKFPSQTSPIQFTNDKLSVEFKGNVFSFFLDPEVFIDIKIASHFAQSLLCHVRSQDLIFEIGVGSGIISILLSPYVQSIVGSDINEKAVELTQKNIQNNNVANFGVYKGDMLNVLARDKHYDAIIWNPPFLPGRLYGNSTFSDKIKRSIFSLGDYGDEYILELLNSGFNYLKARGAIYYIIPEYIRHDRIAEYIQNNNSYADIIGKQEIVFHFEDGNYYETAYRKFLEEEGFRFRQQDNCLVYNAEYYKVFRME